MNKQTRNVCPLEPSTRKTKYVDGPVEGSMNHTLKAFCIAALCEDPIACRLKKL